MASVSATLPYVSHTIDHVREAISLDRNRAYRQQHDRGPGDPTIGMDPTTEEGDGAVIGGAQIRYSSRTPSSRAAGSQ